MKLPFGLSAYARAAGRLAQVRLLNLIPEQSPTSPGGIVLLQRPGLAEEFDMPSRGLYKEDGVFNGDLFIVSDETLYRVDVEVGSVPGSDRVEWAYTVDGLFLLSGGVVYQTDGTTVTATSFPDSALVASIAQLNSILVAVRADTGTVYFRLPGDTVWNGLDYFSAEREPDPAIGVRALADTLWVYGSSSIEPFIPTGDTGTPFTRLEGASYSRGCKSRDSIAQLDNTLFHAGEDNIVYRLADVPQRISDHSIEERVSLSDTVSSWAFATNGHTLYVMTLDTETLVYDVASQGWTQFTFNGGAFPGLGLYDGVDTYVGGDKVWSMADQSNDDGHAMERLFTSVAATDAPICCDAIEIQLAPGVSDPGDPAAIVQTRYSNDQSRTWSDWQDASTGVSGEYRRRVRVRRLGMIDAPGRVFEHRVTDDVPVRFSGVEMNPPMGGRARGV